MIASRERTNRNSDVKNTRLPRVLIWAIEVGALRIPKRSPIAGVPEKSTVKDPLS